MEVRVRPRRDDDLAALMDIAGTVRHVDGYPPKTPKDPAAFLRADGSLAAFVAKTGDEVVGHVVLHPRSAPEVMVAAASATGRPEAKLGVVARLMVAPHARRLGAARALLAAAAAEAHRRDLWPILDVARHFGPAIALYADAGWERAAAVTIEFGDGRILDAFVYIGPPPPHRQP